MVVYTAKVGIITTNRLTVVLIPTIIRAVNKLVSEKSIKIAAF